MVYLLSPTIESVSVYAVAGCILKGNINIIASAAIIAAIAPGHNVASRDVRSTLLIRSEDVISWGFSGVSRVSHPQQVAGGGGREGRQGRCVYLGLIWCVTFNSQSSLERPRKP